DPFLRLGRMEIEERARYVGGDLLPEIVLAHLRLLNHRVLLRGPALTAEAVQQGDAHGYRELSGAPGGPEREAALSVIGLEPYPRQHLALDRGFRDLRDGATGLFHLQFRPGVQCLIDGVLLGGRYTRRPQGGTQGVVEREDGLYRINAEGPCQSDPGLVVLVSGHDERPGRHGDLGLRPRRVDGPGHAGLELGLSQR